MKAIKSSAFRWIAFIILVVLVIGGGSVYYFTQLTSTPQKTLQTYCDALKGEDCQTAYHQLSKRAQGEASELAFADSRGFVLGCTVGTVMQISNTAATGSVRYRFSGGRSALSPTPLVYEEGNWKIDYNLVTNK